MLESSRNDTGDPGHDAAPLAFGLIVIGDEVLNAGRTDGHLTAFKDLLGRRGHRLAWFWLLPDEPPVLTAHLARSMADGLPVFCCGGIGATPDDHTRACAAAAAGVDLVRHAGALALIEGRFGAEAWPHRVRMADLPADSGLIPNPVNQMPGFELNRHWFLPGFPQMAWPMAAWVLDRHYPVGLKAVERAVRVFGVPESQLIPLLERLDGRFAGLKLFSLPHLPANAAARAGREPVVDEPSVLLGFRGHGDVDTALAVLIAELDALGFRYRADDS